MKRLVADLSGTYKRILNEGPRPQQNEHTMTVVLLTMVRFINITTFETCATFVEGTKNVPENLFTNVSFVSFVRRVTMLPRSVTECCAQRVSVLPAVKRLEIASSMNVHSIGFRLSEIGRLLIRLVAFPGQHHSQE